MGRTSLRGHDLQNYLPAKTVIAWLGMYKVSMEAVPQQPTVGKYSLTTVGTACHYCV